MVLDFVTKYRLLDCVSYQLSKDRSLSYIYTVLHTHDRSNYYGILPFYNEIIIKWLVNKIIVYLTILISFLSFIAILVKLVSFTFQYLRSFSYVSNNRISVSYSFFCSRLFLFLSFLYLSSSFLFCVSCIIDSDK